MSPARIACQSGLVFIFADHDRNEDQLRQLEKKKKILEMQQRAKKLEEENALLEESMKQPAAASEPRTVDGVSKGVTDLTYEAADFDTISIDGRKVVSVQFSVDPSKFIINFEADLEGGQTSLMTIDEAGEAAVRDHIKAHSKQSVALGSKKALKKLSAALGLKNIHYAALCRLPLGQRVSEACTTSGSLPSVTAVGKIPCVLKLLNLAGAGDDEIMRIGKQTRATLASLSPFNTEEARQRAVVQPPSVSAKDTPSFKQLLHAKYRVELEATKGKPLCTKEAKASIASALWSVLCSHALKPGASEKVTQLHLQGEEVFTKEACEKVKIWWGQSGNSEARKLKTEWHSKRPSEAPDYGPPPKRSPSSSSSLPTQDSQSPSPLSTQDAPALPTPAPSPAVSGMASGPPGGASLAV